MRRLKGSKKVVWVLNIKTDNLRIISLGSNVALDKCISFIPQNLSQRRVTVSNASQTVYSI